MSDILPDHIVRELASKLASDQLVLFVGAGISHQAREKSGGPRRMPLWHELASRVGEMHGVGIEDYGGSLLDMFDGLSENIGRLALEDTVRKVLDDDAFAPTETHAIIAELPWHLVYTTNYDSLLARALTELDPIVTERDFEKLRRPDGQRPGLVHLHGNLANMHTLTGDDFGLWKERHPVAWANLTEDGLNKTFLFIGYSNSDPHFRYGLFPWLRQVSEGRHGRNYAWMWRASEQQIELHRSKGLEVASIPADDAWEAALNQLLAACEGLKKGRGRTRKLSKHSGHGDDQIYINGYKLFYHRTKDRLSVNDLSRLSSVDYGRIRRLERVSKLATPGPSCFAVSNRREIARLEEALNCRGSLQYGTGDDFLATYIMYYKVNSGSRGKRTSNSQLSFTPETKAVVFDFGGTLTLPNPPYNTWEKMWLAVGYQIAEAADLHRQFSHGKIGHETWCDLTRDKLRERGFSKGHMDTIVAGTRPIPGLVKTFQTLNQRGIPAYIVSGSLRNIIVRVLGDALPLVNGIECNEILFDERGIVSEIRGHNFDFEGKAKYISRIVEDRKCEPLEVLFVGNSLNDHWAIKSGARTLCVNPSHTDFTDGMVWSNYIKEMKDLTEIMKYI